MNLQLAVKDEEIYILEVNPRASRTAPFVSKAKGVPWPHIAAKVMMGASLVELNIEEVADSGFFAVKEPVFPFSKFQGVDTVLGPEMKSTGEVMGIDERFGSAFAKAMVGAGNTLPREGKVFVSVRDEDKRMILPLVDRIAALGYDIVATSGTARALAKSPIADMTAPMASSSRCVAAVLAKET